MRRDKPADLTVANFIQHEQNQYGNWITRFRCESCGMEFTFTPAVDEQHAAGWANCLGEECPSYRIDRDPFAMQLLGEAGPIMQAPQEDRDE